MNKALKIGAVILGILLIAALVIFIFFPGLPTYFKVKYKYEYIDRTIGDFETVNVPVTFDKFSIKGVSFKVPGDYKKSGSGSTVRSSDNKAVVFVIETDSVKTAELLNKYSEEEYDRWEYYKYEESDYKHFFRTLDEEFPTNYDAASDILWFIKDRLTAKDCLKLRGRDMDIFLELAESKENAWNLENAWKINGSGFTAYVSENITGEYEENFWTITIYPDDNERIHYFAVVKGADEEVTKQIISSITL